MKTFFSIIAVVVGLFVLLEAVNIFAFGNYAFFAPRYTAVQNKVFQQSQQYNEGMVRDLEDIKRQYLNATPEQKETLRALAIHRFEVYPEDRLPPDLDQFYRSLNP